jgi:hypothetical protein
MLEDRNLTGFYSSKCFFNAFMINKPVRFNIFYKYDKEGLIQICENLIQVKFETGNTF